MASSVNNEDQLSGIFDGKKPPNTKSDSIILIDSAYISINLMYGLRYKY